MKPDLDALMQKRNLDAIVVFGNAEDNPPMYYLTGGGHVNSAILIKKRNEEPILFCNVMEREEAVKSGLTVKPMRYAPMEEFFNEAGKQAFINVGITSGRVGVYGNADVSVTLSILDHLTQSLPETRGGNPSSSGTKPILAATAGFANGSSSKTRSTPALGRI